MLKHWQKLLNTDCVVVRIGEHYIYPIFRNGSTSLFEVAEETFTNKQISTCKDIIILLRDPEARFISGVSEYCRQNNLDVEETWQLIHDDELVDRHFAPQWIWLLHLYKYYKGKIIIKPFSAIKKYCKVHRHKTKRGSSIALLKDFVEKDFKLMENINQQMEIKNVLPST